MLDTYKELRDNKQILIGQTTDTATKVSPPRLITISGPATIEMKSVQNFLESEMLHRNLTQPKLIVRRRSRANIQMMRRPQ